ncbi:MAG: hypothetical protein VKK42_19865 [Lyngbya sp.]|nr:hypothetical protein [Lyngbya sp.]
MTVTPVDLVKMSQFELDEIYRNSYRGEIPDGNARGTAIITPGSPVTEGMASLINMLAWQGKIFYREQGYLLNKMSPFSWELVDAKVYVGNSLLCEGESIILDYSQSSFFLAQPIRDEIREVAPNLYLGNAYWDKTRVLNFVLEF